MQVCKKKLTAELNPAALPGHVKPVSGQSLGRLDLAGGPADGDLVDPGRLAKAEVDPQEQVIRVLVLEEGTYREHGTFRSGEAAASALLPGFSVGVAETFAQE